MIQFIEREPYSPVNYSYEVDQILYKGKSKYQEILVVENPHFGRMLILDGIVQLTERDEFFYHEMLAQVAMHAHPDPRRVVVIGGGDGGVVREALKHPSVQKLYFVEIDDEVIRISKRFFPTVSGSIDDHRVEIKIMDGAEFISSLDTTVDVVIVDSTDIIGFARSLYTDEFFSNIARCLSPEGLYVTHAESLHFHLDIVTEVLAGLRRHFPIVDLYTAPIATYPGNWWAFCIASRETDPRESPRPCHIHTRYYNEEVHKGSFFPRSLLKKLEAKELNW